MLHSTGPALWKWSNSLVMFERHFKEFIDQQPRVAEVGEPLMQGSTKMWQSAMGSGAVVLSATSLHELPGLLEQFAINSNISTNTTTGVDVLAEGGSSPEFMMTVLKGGYPLLRDGGYFVAEELHGPSYVLNFLQPAATFLGSEFEQGGLASVHLYPFLLLAKRSGGPPGLPSSPPFFDGSHEVVSNYTNLFDALTRNMGGYVVLQNDDWGPLLTAKQLTRAVTMFAALHDAYWHETPTGCGKTRVSVCRLAVINSNMQSLIKGVHIFSSSLVVELAEGPVTIEAVRRGSDWLDV